MSEVLATYTLQLIGPRRVEPGLLGTTDGLHPSFVLETEENLTDLLPEGYRVVIKEWDAPGEGYEVAGLHWSREEGKQ